MTLPLIFSTDIDWFAGSATWMGVFLAWRAMNTWKKQIRLQDRYQKADALLKSFIICTRAGHDWQCDCGVGDAREPTKNSEESAKWRNALMDYRLSWILAHPLFDDNKDRGLSVHPETLQQVIISAGNHLTNHKYDEFYKEIVTSQDAGTKEIISRRDMAK